MAALIDRLEKLVHKLKRDNKEIGFLIEAGDNETVQEAEARYMIKNKLSELRGYKVFVFSDERIRKMKAKE